MLACDGEGGSRTVVGGNVEDRNRAWRVVQPVGDGKLRLRVVFTVDVTEFDFIAESMKQKISQIVAEGRSDCFAIEVTHVADLDQHLHKTEQRFRDIFYRAQSYQFAVAVLYAMSTEDSLENSSARPSGELVNVCVIADMHQRVSPIGDLRSTASCITQVHDKAIAVWEIERQVNTLAVFSGIVQGDLGRESA